MENKNRIKQRNAVKDVKTFDRAAAMAQRMKNAAVKAKDESVSAAAPESRGEENPSGYAETKAVVAARETGHGIAGLVRSHPVRGKTVTNAQEESAIMPGQIKTRECIRLMEAKRSARENAASKPAYAGKDVYAGRAINTRRVRVSQTAIPAKRPENTRLGISAEVRTTKGAAPRVSVVKGKRSSDGRANRFRLNHTSANIAERAKEAARLKAVRERTAQLAAAKVAKRQMTGRAARAGRRSARYVRAVTRAFRKLILAISASGAGIAVFAVMICAVAAIVCSPFGIGFSGEETPDAIDEINKEYDAKIEGIINSTAHDELEVTGARAPWREVLSIYAVRMNMSADKTAAADEADGENMDVTGYTDLQKQELSNIFWDMNKITHKTVTETIAYTPITPSAIDESEWEVGELVTKTAIILKISTVAKSYTEMVSAYGFTEEQKLYIAELLDPKNSGLLEAALYGMDGTGTGSKSIVEVAEKYIGNKGGEIFWRWMGFNSRVSWCACFASYCADEAGYVKTGVLPKSASCEKAGKGSWIHWLKKRGLWREATNYAPRIGDLIFFDWGGDGIADHIGIVEYVKSGTVHTIEGNTSDTVARRSYSLASPKIRGYGSPNY